MKTWMPTQKMYLRDKWGTMPVKDMRPHLDNKSSNSIEQQARKMGLVAVDKSKLIVQERMNEDELKRTPEIKRFHDWVASKGCIITGKPCCIHHEPFKSQGGSHWLVVGLSPEIHTDSNKARHKMSLTAFNKLYGINIRQIALDNWIEWKRNN